MKNTLVLSGLCSVLLANSKISKVDDETVLFENHFNEEPKGSDIVNMGEVKPPAPKADPPKKTNVKTINLSASE